MALTPRQQRFVEEYLGNGRNAAAAYRAAYDTDASPKQNATSGWELLQNPDIARIVQTADERAEAAVAAVIDRYALTQEDIARRLAILGISDARDVLSWDENGVRLKPSAELTDEAAYAITEIGEGDGGRLKVKLADKRASLMDLAKIRGWITDRNQTLGKDGKPVDPVVPALEITINGQSV